MLYLVLAALLSFSTLTLVYRIALGHRPGPCFRTEALIPSCLGVLAAHGSQLSLSQGTALRKRELPPPKLSKLPWGSHTPSDWLMWRYKGPVPSPQFRTSLKGFASFRASDRISLGLCCNCFTVQLSCPLLHPTRVLLLKDFPINSLHTRDLWLRVTCASQTLLNKRVPLNL